MLHELAVGCFPNGVPRHSERWAQPDGVDEEKFTDLITRLLVRTPPECLTNRWYSADIASWSYLMQWRMSALEYFIPLTANVSWRPGMYEEEGAPPEVKEEEARKRTQTTIQFVRSYECGHSLVLGSYGSSVRYSFFALKKLIVAFLLIRYDINHPLKVYSICSIMGRFRVF